MRVGEYAPPQVKKAIGIIRATDVWQQLLQCHRAGEDPFELQRFQRAPHQLLDELARHNYFTHPDANGIILASCSCLAHRGPGWMCKHAAALCYVLIHTCEVDPLSYLNALGLHSPIKHAGW